MRADDFVGPPTFAQDVSRRSISSDTSYFIYVAVQQRLGRSAMPRHLWRLMRPRLVISQPREEK